MSYESTKRARLDIEKSPTEWFDLPLEMREIVIDAMDSKTRCRFAQCSKTCEKEAKSSKNYLCGIGISRCAHPELLIGHGSKYLIYCLEFIDIGNLTEPQTIIVYKTNKIPENRQCNIKAKPGILKWTKVVSGNAEDVRMKYLDEFLEKYHKTITTLFIDDTSFPIDRYSMKHLKKLKYMTIDISTDVLETGFLDLKQVLRGDLVILKKTKLSFDQILQFEGTSLAIECDEFGLENIKKYLKMWKNGEINKNTISVSVLDEKRELFDIRDIIEGLDVYDFSEQLYTENDYQSFFTFDFTHKRNGNFYNEVTYSTGCLTIQTSD